MALGGRSWDDWIAQYSTSHQDPRNRLCHFFGIPMIVVSLAIGAVALVLLAFSNPAAAPVGLTALALFVLGWLLQFAGHAMEGKPPEFLSDWRFLFVGTRWWAVKVLGRKS